MALASKGRNGPCRGTNFLFPPWKRDHAAASTYLRRVGSLRLWRTGRRRVRPCCRKISHDRQRVRSAICWLFPEELALPATRLSNTPDKYPLRDHFNALAARLVFGLTTELTRKSTRELLETELGKIDLPTFRQRWGMAYRGSLNHHH